MEEEERMGNLTQNASVLNSVISQLHASADTHKHFSLHCAQLIENLVTTTTTSDSMVINRRAHQIWNKNR